MGKHSADIKAVIVELSGNPLDDAVLISITMDCGRLQQ